MIRAHGTARGEQKAAELDRGHAENETAFLKAMRELFNGSANVVYTSHTGLDWHGNAYTNYTAYHRSPKNPGKVQESHYYIKHGNIYALSDAQHDSPEAAYKYGVVSGAYIIR